MSKKSSEKELEIKVVLLGESGVGKSCIISRFANDIFAQFNLSTILCSNTSKTISLNKNKDIITYSIWDTAGQEKYRAITKNHYQDADVILLVFDISNEDSFQNIKDYWYPQIRENAPKNVIIALVASKCDLKDDYKIDLDDVNVYAQKINAIFKETSAKDDFGINELFEEIGYKILSYDDFKSMIFKRNKTFLTYVTTEDDENSIRSSRSIALINEKNIKKKIKQRCC